MTTAANIAAALATAAKGAHITLRGYRTADGRTCDYTLVVGTYGDAERAALKSLRQIDSATVAAHTGVSRAVARTVLNTYRDGLVARVARLEQHGERPVVVAGKVFGQVVARSLPPARKVSRQGEAAMVRSWLESAARLDTFRAFTLDSAESIEVDGVELCWECGARWDSHLNNGDCPSASSTVDPYAYGLGKVSALEGEGSW